MDQVTIVGLDLAKRVFQVHGATADGRALSTAELISPSELQAG